ncbi:MAG TPA: MFS transporter [Acidimicrobiia bacterium]|nr:MFS transporter [Acidimicrobiia bacterium]
MVERRRLHRRLIVDLTPLRESPRFRILYIAQLLASIGRQITVVAVPFQVYILTESTLAVGALGLAQFIPLMVVSIIGGAVADAFDRRVLLVAGHLLLALTALGLVFNASLAEPAIWPLYVLSAINAAFTAFNNPARMAAIPALLRRELIAPGFALNSTMHEVAAAIGPAIAGLLIAQYDLVVAYSVEAIAFLAAALTLLRVGQLRPEGGGRAVGMTSIREGFHYLKGQPLIQSGFLIDLNAMIFGMPQALFPALGTMTFGGDASTVGLLYAAPGIGALVAALTSGWVGSVSRRGRVVVVAVVIWGVAIAIFGLLTNLALALALLAVAGAADVVSAVMRNTILQLTVPDQLRGRLSAVHTAVVGGGPRLGDLEAGAVAALTSVRFSVVSGGVACVIGALAIARWMPQLWNYRDEDIGSPTG